MDSSETVPRPTDEHRPAWPARLASSRSARGALAPAASLLAPPTGGRPAGRLVRAAFAVVAGLGAPGGVATLAGCAADEVAGLSPVADIVIEPAAPVVALDGTIRLTATARDASGQPLADRGVLWASGDPAMAAVSADGVVTPHAVGRVQIAASAEGHSAIVEVQVTPGSVAEIALSPSPVSLVQGSTARIAASMRDAAGHDVSSRPVSWSTSAASVATVDASGVVTGVAPGTATITAQSEGRTATVAVSVTAPPVVTPPTPAPAPAARLEMVSGNEQSAKGGSELAQPLVVRVVDASGRALSNVLVTWTPSDGGSARPAPITLTNAQGLASVRWKLGNAEKTQTMRVSAIGLATVTFTARATKR
jgi:uncharacterized protein YjdB